jgi:hypothetical protein
MGTTPTVVTTLSPEQFKEALPPQMRKSVNPEVINKVNDLLSNPDMHEQYRENLLSFSRVLTEGKFKLTGYIDAVKYVSLKVCGLTNQRAFEITFPNKIKDWMARGVAAKDISSYVSSYNKSKLVNLIYEQTLVPTHILNADLFQKALNVQADLMMTANSEMVRTTAANSLLTQLRPPETKKVELDIKTTESTAVAELRQATLELAAQQRLAIQAGQMNAQQVAHSKIIEGEIVEEAE